jgi:hypothetical protein
VADPGDVLQNPAMGTTLEYVETSGSSGARRLVMDWIIPPGRRLVSLAHRHPRGSEQWEALEGRAGYRIGREERVEDAPHAWVVPQNAPHVHPWNAGDGELRVRQAIESPEPDEQLIAGVERYFETLCALGQQGKTNAKGDIRNPLQAGISIRELLMPDTYLAGPPGWLQDALFGGLAAVARLLGRSAYVEPQRIR